MFCGEQQLKRHLRVNTLTKRASVYTAVRHVALNSFGVNISFIQGADGLRSINLEQMMRSSFSLITRLVEFARKCGAQIVAHTLAMSSKARGIPRQLTKDGASIRSPWNLRGSRLAG